MSELYPTIQEVEQADKKQLSFWYRHLPPPGVQAEHYDHEALRKKIALEEQMVMQRITERFKDLGGFANG